MDRLVDTLLINGLTATVLALGVALASRFIRRASVVHALWVIVLLKLITPAVFEVGLLPPPSATPAPTSTVVLPIDAGSPSPAARPGISAARAARPTASIDPPLDRTRFLQPGALGIWFSGSLLVLLLALWRAARFQRLLRAARAPQAPLQSRVAGLASLLGLAPCPVVRVVPARISPLVWFPFHRLELLFPERLLEQLETAERDTLLAHELAHVRRGDHWVRYLELTVGALFWWHPVVWWARRRLRQAEERSCDEWVLRALPDQSRAYAGGLLKTLEFLAGSDSRIPSLASGAADADNLKERLTMILNNVTPRRLTRPQLALLGVAAVALLVVFPSRADRSREPADPDKGTISEERALELERQVEELRNELRLLREQSIEMRWVPEARRVDEAMEDLVARVAWLEAQGRTEEADSLRLDAENQQRLALMHREIEHRQMAQTEQVMELERQLAQVLTEAEQQQGSGNGAAAKRLQEQARALRMELAERNGQLEERGLAMFEADQLRLRGQLDPLRGAAREQEARMLELELQQAERMRARVHEAARAADPASREQRIQELLNEVERLREEQQRDDSLRQEGVR